MTHSPIDSVDEAVENIARYQAAVAAEPMLAARMRHVLAWYAVRSVDGTWSFGPSKFIGYANISAGAYLWDPALRNPRPREAALRKWFDVVPRDTPFWAELADALRKFLNAHRQPGPRRDAWICTPKDLFLLRRPVPFGRTSLERIGMDAAICGGRPRIRGTRVRVSDILDLLASGASPSDILADYPYLTKADLRAALAYGAAATAHRVILVD